MSIHLQIAQAKAKSEAAGKPIDTFFLGKKQWAELFSADPTSSYVVRGRKERRKEEDIEYIHVADKDDYFVYASGYHPRIK